MVEEEKNNNSDVNGLNNNEVSNDGNNPVNEEIIIKEDGVSSVVDAGDDKSKPDDIEDAKCAEEITIDSVDAEIVDEPELSREEIAELIKKSMERDEYLDKLQRTRAEYSNFQKRKNKETQDLVRYASQGLIVEFTSILDNFDRAISSSQESKDFDKLFEGIQLVENQFYKTLEKNGVKPIETEGKPFDPVMHEALIEEENNDKPHHTVLMELQKGYLLHDRVIRPAKVKVSKRTDDNEDSGEADAVEVEADKGENGCNCDANECDTKDSE